MSSCHFKITSPPEDRHQTMLIAVRSILSTRPQAQCPFWSSTRPWSKSETLTIWLSWSRGQGHTGCAASSRWSLHPSGTPADSSSRISATRTTTCSRSKLVCLTDWLTDWINEIALCIQPCRREVRGRAGNIHSSAERLQRPDEGQGLQEIGHFCQIQAAACSARNERSRRNREVRQTYCRNYKKKKKRLAVISITTLLQLALSFPRNSR